MPTVPSNGSGSEGTTVDDGGGLAVSSWETGATSTVVVEGVCAGPVSRASRAQPANDKAAPMTCAALMPLLPYSAHTALSTSLMEPGQALDEQLPSASQNSQASSSPLAQSISRTPQPQSQARSP